MRPGDVIAERFEIEHLAGSGGMGAVWRAIDRASGGPVAVKVLSETSEGSRRRFAREAALLAELDHPSVVRYVAYGNTDSGEPFLVMEWLEGEDLASRLERVGLTLAESVSIARAVASALAVAHARGIVHRDVKPANVFLVEGDVSRVKLMDFGVARTRHATRALTFAGAVVGTPGYMAPEQARGDADVDARADVFALGCVLYQCITGQPLFVGEHVMALLAKILIAPAPRVHELRPDVPSALDTLVAHMVDKDRDARLADATSVIAALDALGDLSASGTESAPPSARAEALTIREQRLLSVVVASPGNLDAAAIEDTLPGAEPAAFVEGLTELVGPHGGRVEHLFDGSLVITLVGAGAATDQAARAARCALSVRSRVGGLGMALATGRGDVSGRWPVGEVIDRAVRLTARRAQRDPSAIAIDDVTAGLVGSAFDVRGDDDGLVLRGERESIDPTRTLLGKPSPCVGREREISALMGVWTECVEEGVARAALVTAPAGVGKSRVRFEFVAKARESNPDTEVLLGRADPMSPGAPFGIVAPAIRRAAGVLESEPATVRRRKLQARVARHLGAEAERVAMFLGELIGTPFPDTGNEQLRAARNEPALMADQIQRAWIDWLDVECSAQPVLLVLEDLHWGDLPSVRLVDAALRDLAERPLMVLATARPEVQTLFPDLWASRIAASLRLPELSRKASERLALQVLGDRVSPEILARAVEHAAGNAFYLEELVRALASGRQDALPGSVIAMVQSRLETLEPESRRVLRAASVFGEVFWLGGVRELLGGVTRASPVAEALRDLEAHEFVSRRGEGRFASEIEYAFRHAIVREAAYAMLTEHDRVLGHKLAGAWLEQVGETDALSIAEHLERAGESARAARWFARSAAQSIDAADPAAAKTRVDRGLACEPDDPLRGELYLIRASALDDLGANVEGLQAASDALSRVPDGTQAHFQALELAAMFAERSGRIDLVDPFAERLMTQFARREYVDGLVRAGARVASHLFAWSRETRAAEVLSRAREAVAAGAPVDLLTEAALARAESWNAMYAGDLADTLRFELRAGEMFARAGDRRNACICRAGAGFAMLDLGLYAEAVPVLREALATAERLGLRTPAGVAEQNLGLVLARSGALDEGRAFEQASVERFVSTHNPRLEAASRMYLAWIELAAGDLDAAEREAAHACEMVPDVPDLRCSALGRLARARLRKGNVDGALEAARQAQSLLGSSPHADEGEALARLVLAEALAARGDLEGARAALRSARDRLLERAARISDEAWRRSFLENVPDHAETIRLAREWLA